MYPLKTEKNIKSKIKLIKQNNKCVLSWIKNQSIELFDNLSEEIGIKSNSEVWFDTLRRLGSNLIQRYGLTLLEEIGIKSNSEVWFDTLRGDWDQIQFRGMVWQSQDYHPIVNAEWNNSGFDIINVIISSF